MNTPRDRTSQYLELITIQYDLVSYTFVYAAGPDVVIVAPYNGNRVAFVAIGSIPVGGAFYARKDGKLFGLPYSVSSLELSITTQQFLIIPQQEIVFAAAAGMADPINCWGIVKR